MKMAGRLERKKISWVLSYIQGETVEVWKENVMEEITEGMLEAETVEELFQKIRAEFEEMDEESRKVDKLQALE